MPSKTENLMNTQPARVIMWAVAGVIDATLVLAWTLGWISPETAGALIAWITAVIGISTEALRGKVWSPESHDLDKNQAVKREQDKAKKAVKVEKKPSPKKT